MWLKPGAIVFILITLAKTTLQDVLFSFPTIYVEHKTTVLNMFDRHRTKTHRTEEWDGSVEITLSKLYSVLRYVHYPTPIHTHSISPSVQYSRSWRNNEINPWQAHQMTNLDLYGNIRDCWFNYEKKVQTKPIFRGWNNWLSYPNVPTCGVIMRICRSWTTRRSFCCLLWVILTIPLQLEINNARGTRRVKALCYWLAGLIMLIIIKATW